MAGDVLAGYLGSTCISAIFVQCQNATGITLAVGDDIGKVEHITTAKARDRLPRQRTGNCPGRTQINNDRSKINVFTADAAHRARTGADIAAIDQRARVKRVHGGIRIMAGTEDGSSIHQRVIDTGSAEAGIPAADRSGYRICDAVAVAGNLDPLENTKNETVVHNRNQTTIERNKSMIADNQGSPHDLLKIVH
jgi:hypothetical protein